MNSKLNLHQKAIASHKKRGLFTEMETGSMKKEDVVMKELQTPAILTGAYINYTMVTQLLNTTCFR